MITVRNPLGEDLNELNKYTVAERVGQRIRKIRESREMTQDELGKRVSLNGDRVHKYEHGERKPKDELLKQFAAALGVETYALLDPVVSNYFGAMHAFFEMEDIYELKVEQLSNDRIALTFGDGKNGAMNDYLELWLEKKGQCLKELEEADDDDERMGILHSYDIWKWNFPSSVTMDKYGLKEYRKKKIRNHIEQLKKELKELDEQ
ncbi:MAG: helix-turn-helix domain-containing protein [Lachnospiraceae bacterium]|nr:helix-turn-helix domain-containing protein [Lachnospiraceae bacterium]